MKINQQRAFEILKELEEKYPTPYDLSLCECETKKNDDGITYTIEMKKDDRPYAEYLKGEGLIFSPNNSNDVILTSKAINLLNGYDSMEDWIRKKCHAS